MLGKINWAYKLSRKIGNDVLMSWNIICKIDVNEKQ